MTTIGDLFAVSYGNKLDMNKMAISNKKDGIAFVGRVGGLNGRSGVSGYVSRVPSVEPYPANLITVALGGSRLLSSYVQQRPFYTAQNVAVLKPNDPKMPLLHRLFYAMCIRENSFRYTAFGREANRTLSTIQIPAPVPDWVGGSEIPTVEGMSRAAAQYEELSNPEFWREFFIGSLFDVRKGQRVTKANRSPGETRFIGASEKNNGITDMCDLAPLFPAHCLTVPYNGNSVGVAFYQDQPFFASDDVQVLIPKEPVSRWSMLFVATIIRYERTRYTYGYKWNLARMKMTPIRLPVTEEGVPDWRFMECVMHGLPFSAAIMAATEE